MAGVAKMATDFQVLQANDHADGRQYSATRVLPHPFHTLMSPQQPWVAIGNVASTSADRFITLAQGLRFDLSQNGRRLPGAPGNE